MLAPLLVFAFALGLYGLTAHGYVDVEDTEICYQAVTGFLDDSSFAIPDTPNGRALIAQRFFVAAGDDGRWYPVYPLLQLLLGVPGAAAGRALAGFANERPDEVVRLCFTLPNVLFGALCALVIYGLGRRLGQSVRGAAATGMLGAAATMLWPMGQSSFVDPPLALFVAASTFCLLSARRPLADDEDRGHPVLPWLLLAGLLHGAACGLRPSAFLLLLPAVLHLRPLGYRALLAFALPIAAVVGGLAWLDVEVFGRPLAAGYVGHAQAKAPVLTPSYTLCLHGLLASDGRGLFVLSPLLLLAVLGWPALRRRAPAAAWLALGQLTVLALFFAAFDGWHGGWCWGPRYLLPAVPLLAAVAGCWWQQRGRWRATLGAVLVALSLGIQVLAVAVPHRIYLVTAASSPAHIYQFFFYTRYSPVAAHARILAHKLRGEPEVYSLRELFGDADDRPVEVTKAPQPQIDGYSQGFRHFALWRVFEKGHRTAAIAATAGCALAVLGALWLLRRLPRAVREPV